MLLKKNIEIIKKMRWILLLGLLSSNTLLFLLLEYQNEDHDCFLAINQSRPKGQIKVLIHGLLKTKFEPYAEVSLLDQHHKLILEKAILLDHRKPENPEVLHEIADEFLILIAESDLPKVMNIKNVQIYPKSNFLVKEVKTKVQHEISF
jgi:hypothetical protein